METVPQLGDSVRMCTQRLGQPLVSQTLDGTAGLLVQQYPFPFGALTILFDHTCSVAFYVAYASPCPQPAALKAAVVLLMTPSGERKRLRIDDGGWFVVGAGCTAAALERFAQAMRSLARQAQLATWACAHADLVTAARNDTARLAPT